MTTLGHQPSDNRCSIGTNQSTASVGSAGKGWSNQTSPLDRCVAERTARPRSTPGAANTATAIGGGSTGQPDAVNVVVHAEKNLPARLQREVTDAVSISKGLV